MKKAILIIVLLAVACHANSQINHDKTKRIEVFTKWMRKNSITFNQLPKVKSSELVSDCDRNLIIKRIIGDTLMYWIKSSSYVTGDRYDKKLLKELDQRLSNASFGLTEYVEKLDDNGCLVLVTLSPIKFKIKSDTLFKLESFFKVPLDSIEALITEAVSNSKRYNVNKNVIIENSYSEFRPIFYPNMFKEQQVFNRSEDKIVLDHEWVIDGKKYYQISFMSESDGQITKFPTYIFDDKYNFLQYNGCNSDELKLLTAENEVLAKP